MNYDLLKLISWSKFFGWVLIVLGIVSCVTVIGIITGVFMIFMGRSLINGSKFAKEFDKQGVILDNNLKGMITSYKNFFALQGFVLILTAAFIAIGLSMNLIDYLYQFLSNLLFA